MIYWVITPFTTSILYFNDKDADLRDHQQVDFLGEFVTASG